MCTMIFDLNEFTAENKNEKTEQAWSFAKFIIKDESKLDNLNLTQHEKIKLLENLIFIHEKSDKFEECSKLIDIKNRLIPID